jgi:hypothetical protein
MLGPLDVVIGDDIPSPTSLKGNSGVQIVQDVVLDEVVAGIAKYVNTITPVSGKRLRSVEIIVSDFISVGSPSQDNMLLGKVVALDALDPTITTIRHQNSATGSVPDGRFDIEVFNAGVLDRRVRMHIKLRQVRRLEIIIEGTIESDRVT